MNDEIMNRINILVFRRGYPDVNIKGVCNIISIYIYAHIKVQGSKNIQSTTSE